MGMMYVAIMGFLLLIVLIALMPGITTILSVVSFALSPLVLGVLSLIGIIVVISFFWYAGEAVGA